MEKSTLQLMRDIDKLIDSMIASTYTPKILVVDDLYYYALSMYKFLFAVYPISEDYMDTYRGLKIIHKNNAAICEEKKDA